MWRRRATDYHDALQRVRRVVRGEDLLQVYPRTRDPVHLRDYLARLDYAGDCKLIATTIAKDKA